MILADIRDKMRYYGLSSDIETALRYLENAKFSAPGKVILDGEKIFVNLSEYETAPKDVIYEAHDKYIDIQYLYEGEETVYVARRDSLSEVTPYDEAKDAGFLKGDGDAVTLSKGKFLILYPEDAHAPCIMKDKPSKVQKAVVKVRA